MRVGTPFEGRRWIAGTALPGAGRPLAVLFGVRLQAGHFVDRMLCAVLAATWLAAAWLGETVLLQ